jgi:DNA mismatch repair protein MutS
MTQAVQPNLTPMLNQYQSLKEQHPDALVFFRLGDFYELFFDDAVVASKLLDLVLTGRGQNENRAPMCGVPYHAASGYIQKLVDLGHRVAIVEQMEDPALTKGLVKREVVRIVSPGTSLSDALDETQSIRVAAVERFANHVYVVMCELISGELLAMRYRMDDALLASELLKYNVKEVLLSDEASLNWGERLRAQGVLMLPRSSTELESAYQNYFDLLEEEPFKRSAGRLIEYLVQTQRRALTHLKPVRYAKLNTSLWMDHQTSINLELVESLHSDQKAASLFWFLNVCETAMGARTLKHWVLNPLNELAAIQSRQRIIEALMDDFKRFDTIKQALAQCYDVERIIGRLALGSANPQDFARLRQTLNHVPQLRAALSDPTFAELIEFNPLNDLSLQLNQALNETMPLWIKEGNVFRSGYNAQLDAYRDAQRKGQTWLMEFEQTERQRTGIKTLKVGYNRVFGYYVEISKAQALLVDESFGYVRKQTLSNQERFITPELKAMEDQILNATDRSLRLEETLFEALIQSTLEYRSELQILAERLATIDALISLAHQAKTHHWVKPELHEGQELVIDEGRHPILDAKAHYVSNSTHFEHAHTVHILTGPNMGGKSTYMRQVALLVILAHMGSFIPAKSARIPLIDAVFTRMGASDDILSGQSTFMVEMDQANVALQNATPRSLILFDEIGRGTSTYDGMAIALAMVEYISTTLKCKCIFSTHYHELTTLEMSHPSVANIHVEVKDRSGDLEFLYRIKPGGADRSYGLNVAKLAKLPNAVLKRAETALKELESSKRTVQQTLEIVELVHIPKSLERIQTELKALDLNQTTPLEALKVLDEWKKDVE